MDQVQNLTSLVAREKQSTELGAEESTRLQVNITIDPLIMEVSKQITNELLQVKVQQLTDQLEWERQTTVAANEKVALLEASVVTLRAQNEAQAQAHARNDAEISHARENAQRSDAEIAQSRESIERMRNDYDAKLREAEQRAANLSSEAELLNQTVLYLFRLFDVFICNFSGVFYLIVERHLQLQLKNGMENRDRDSDSTNKRMSLLDKTNADLLLSNGNLEQLLKERGEEARSWQDKYNTIEKKLNDVLIFPSFYIGLY